jgi:hypothetical protein
VISEGKRGIAADVQHRVANEAVKDVVIDVGTIADAAELAEWPEVQYG